MDKSISFLKRNWAIFLLFFSYLVIFLWQQQIGELLSNSELKLLIGDSIYQGWLGLVDYLQAHVLFCLIPAFFIAGAVNSLISSQAIFKYFGAQSKRWLAYSIASVSGFLVQVCSCTILPLFAGIWKKGAGLGVATTFLYAGPAVNLLALILTGQRIGWDFALFRFVMSIVFAITTGLIMEFVFKDKDQSKSESLATVANNEISIKGKKSKIFWINLLAILIVGTAPIESTIIIVLGATPIEFVIKNTLVYFLAGIQLILSFSWLSKNNRENWWAETTKFFNQIIPLLLVGVFFASFLTNMIPQDRFQEITGQNTLLTNFVAVLFGAIAYFPALVEVPIAENFLRLGMNKGPLMAYLLSDPVLSLQGLLIIQKLIGTKKTLVYASTVVILTTLAGLIYGGL